MHEAQHGGGEGGEKGRMTMIRCRWNYADLRGKHGGEVMPKGDRAENRKERERGSRCRERECGGETDRC